MMTEYENAIENMIKKYNGGYIGVDLDGTLAEHHTWIGPYHIGKPIQKMVDRVKVWLAAGMEVRIITARAEPLEDGNPDPAVITAIQNWTEKVVGQRLMVTNQKTYGLIELWDDRAIQVIPNTGDRADGK